MNIQTSPIIKEWERKKKTQKKNKENGEKQNKRKIGRCHKMQKDEKETTKMFKKTIKKRKIGEI